LRCIQTSVSGADAENGQSSENPELFFSLFFLSFQPDKVMTMHDALMKHGAFSWNELMTPDVHAARSFYGALFGWTFENFLGAGAPYTLVKVDGETVGGMMAPTSAYAGQPPAWGVCVTVEDVDATARQVETLGGKLLRPPEDVPGFGRFCVLQDPQGATLCALTYRQP